MANHSRLSDVATAKRAAQAAGYDIREGSYRNTTDDRLGRYYITHKDHTDFRPYGGGHHSRGAAWIAAAEQAKEDEWMRKMDADCAAYDRGYRGE